MKRGREIAFTVAATALAVVIVLGVLYRRVALDHLEAWHFQVTRETETIEPEPAVRGVPKVLEASPSGVSFYTKALFSGNLVGHPWYQASDFVRILANHSGHYAIFGTQENSEQIILGAKFDGVTASIAKGILEANGWRVIEQCFPRKAYVVIRNENARRSHEGIGEIGVLSQRIACPGVDNGPMEEAAAASYKEPWMRAISLPTPLDVPSRP